MSTISERLSYLITTLSLKKKQFADAIGISTGNLSDWLAGRSNPSYSASKKIEQVYGISAKWLMEGIGEMYNTPDETRDYEKLTPQEKRILKFFRSLSYEEKLKIEGLLEYKAAENTNKNQESSHLESVDSNLLA